MAWTRHNWQTESKTCFGTIRSFFGVFYLLCLSNWGKHLMNPIKAFQEMDANSDGRVTQEEFVKACLNQATISKMLALKVIDVFTGSESSKWKKMLLTIVSYVSSFRASQVFYFVISRSATFSLTNLAVIVGFEDLRPSNSHGFQSRLFLIKLPMRRSGDKKLCLKYLKYLQ